MIVDMRYVSPLLRKRCVGMNMGITAEKKMMSRRVIRSKAQARSPLFVLFAVMAVALVCIILSFAVLPAFAGASSSREKLYTNYEIKQGDSLWSISSDFYCPEYSDSDKFIKEVMVLNHLTDPDNIHEGSYLVLPYYADINSIPPPAELAPDLRSL